jgi:hypothetical protein
MQRRVQLLVGGEDMQRQLRDLEAAPQPQPYFVGPPPDRLTAEQTVQANCRLIDQLNRQGDFAILSTAKTKIALSRFKGLRALTDGLNRDT